MNPAEQLRQAADAVARLGCSSADLAALPDAAVLTGQSQIAEARRLLEMYAAWMAATIADRSRPELGHSGLAAQQGFLSPEAMIQKVTGSSKNEAFKLVAVGTMLARAEAADRQAAEALEAAGADGTGVDGTGADGTSVDGTGAGGDSGGLGGTGGLGGFPSDPAGAGSWQAPIARAVTAGTLSVDAAESIRKGLGDIDTAVTADTLATALTQLLAESATLNADQCFTRARRMRDDLDQAGIAAREKQAYDDRFLKVYRLPDGKVRLHGLFAPEDGEFVLSTYDSITSPRRGGVRFVDPKRAAWAKAVQDDPRSTAQIAADSFVQLLKIAGEADPGQMLGGRRPTVRIIVTQKDLTNTTRTNTGIGSGSAPDAADAAGAFPSTPHTTAPGPLGAPGMPAGPRPMPAGRPATAAPPPPACPANPAGPIRWANSASPIRPTRPTHRANPAGRAWPTPAASRSRPIRPDQPNRPSHPRWANRAIRANRANRPT
ncbi:hypothetical protein RCH16_002368 [Cryobacterium sp. MP_M5]|uniref:DUF222 domain-containing protein n=1 Tax=unclassified Cryobacterium TaxID=2649013 RepID=UPI0018C8FC4D|nr:MULTISPECIES: DUF222 domain-containing protein [unclassified Cryobacterium]MBG6059061.1 hypothetical protein [Cryobacterium sp. MP_M3]MEC5177355.1 hypothetical protein [Cryobacterium sp. MP_M5]